MAIFSLLNCLLALKKSNKKKDTLPCGIECPSYVCRGDYIIMSNNSQENQNNSKDNRSTCWATVVYEESATENWQEIARSLYVPFFISPYHDRDFDGTGEKPKKPHYHVLFMFSSKKSRKQFEEMISKFGGVGSERIRDRRAYARYLCHLDNPEKAQYNPSDVVAYISDYMEVIGLPSERYLVLEDITDFIEKYNIRSYSTLVLYARHSNNRWFRVLCDSSTLFLTEYIKSREWTKNNANSEFAQLMEKIAAEEEISS